ncbi:hypothetical protein C8Q75DRAFT_802798 [Abortiporus biennis]|nr:hypothetical protein C8Q75DRAFT_802798 [Abortiporus biennis]
MTPRLDRALPAVPMPYEIMVSIFQYLASPILRPADPFAQYPANQMGYKDCETARNIQLTLLYAAVVCRSWHDTAIDILYRSPHLLSARQIRSFCRTLRSFPSLSDCVRSVFVLDPIRNGLPPSKQDPFTRLVAVREDLKYILQHLSPEKLILHIRNTDSRTSIFIPDFLINNRQNRLHTRLRTLDIHGYSVLWDGSCGIPLRFSQIELPNLEVLSIQQVDFQCGAEHEGAHYFPPMPRLHTLRMCRCSWGTFMPISQSPDAFPSLKTVELYHNRFNRFLYPNCNLDNLTLIGRYEVWPCTDVRHPPFATKSLTLGGTWILDQSVIRQENIGMPVNMVWQFPLHFPDTVENLTFLVPPAPSIDNQTHDIKLSEEILNVLKSETELPNLQSLTICYIPQVEGANWRYKQENIRRKKILDDIKVCCLVRGVSLDVKFYTSFNEWLMSQREPVEVVRDPFEDPPEPLGLMDLNLTRFSSR